MCYICTSITVILVQTRPAVANSFALRSDAHNWKLVFETNHVKSSKLVLDFSYQKWLGPFYPVFDWLHAFLSRTVDHPYWKSCFATKVRASTDVSTESCTKDCHSFWDQRISELRVMIVHAPDPKCPLDPECPSRGDEFLKHCRNKFVCLPLSTKSLDQVFSTCIRQSAYLWPDSNFLIGVGYCHKSGCHLPRL